MLNLRNTLGRFALATLALASISTIAPTHAQTASAKSAPALSLRFGVYTSDKPTEMVIKFRGVRGAIEDSLEKSLGRDVRVEMKVFKDYDSAIEALASGEVDFTRFGPASYIISKEINKGVRLLAMEHKKGQKRSKGLIVTRTDSDIHTVADIRGHSFAFGDQNSTIGRYLVQAKLVEAGIHKNDLMSFDYLGRHDAVLKAVELGDFDVGSVKISTYEKLNKDGKLRIVSDFDNVTKPWVSRAGLDEEVFQAIRQALLGIKDEGVLKTLKISGFLPATDDEYKFVRDGMQASTDF